jgi:crotonobetainyl-CoA:carnitine CoA-transferase CaiB-like acyl-CoA transferase
MSKDAGSFPSVAHMLADVWHLAGGDPAALARVDLVGSEPVLPSSFRVGAVAQATIAAAGLAASEVHRARTGLAQRVRVAMRHAAVEFKSERVYTVDGAPHASVWDKVAGTYRTGDGRWVRLHTNFPHHRDGILRLLGADYSRESVAAALQKWSGQAFEDAVAERGLVATMMRSPAEWAAHPQGQAVAALPLFEVMRIGDAPPRAFPPGARPLAGIRVLDLTRILAGPVCGRTLAAHGADVLRITGPQLPGVRTLDIDTGRGKLSAHIDMKSEAGKATLRGLLADADIFVQGYRPGGLAELGFAPEAVAALRPGIVSVSLSAWSHAGPWSARRGYDSLVQTASGINHAEAEAAGLGDKPHELPCQALDHGAGYLMAVGAMLALERRAREGGSWHVRVSLAQVGHWLTGLGRLPEGPRAPMLGRDDVLELMQESASGYGRLSALTHAAELAATPARWERPSVPLGQDPARWPAH